MAEGPDSTTSGTTSDTIREKIRSSLLSKVADSDAHFKHQQRGEPDLTHEEKFNIAANLLDQKTSQFLSRFGKYLNEGHLEYFEKWSGDYTIDFFIKDIQKRFDDKKNKTKIKNRRYEAMKELVAKGEYFGDEEMKRRDPLLYDQMVGQFLTEDEIQGQVDKCEASFASILMKHVQVQQNNELFQNQKDLERLQTDHMDESENKSLLKNIKPDVESDESELDSDDDEEEKVSIAEDEPTRLREEFTSIMQQRFINGEDTDFNYEEVDDNVDYDSLDIRTQDEEEMYFDKGDTEEDVMDTYCDNSPPGLAR